MRRQSAELKQVARGNLMSNFAIPMGAIVASNLIQNVPLLFFAGNLTEYSSLGDWVIYYLASIVLGLLGAVFAAGNMQISLQIARKKEYGFLDLFYGFKNRPDRYILAQLLIMLITVLPMIPGIGAYIISYDMASIRVLLLGILLAVAGTVVSVILTLKYALVPLLLLDREDVTVTEAFCESSRIMKGNQGRLFYIMLSFIGIEILGILSFGIGFLWIRPYIMQTQIVFYLELTGEYDRDYSSYGEEQTIYDN